MKTVKLSLVVTTILLFVSGFSYAADKNIPQFKITGTYEKICVSILVPENTSKEQLINLIYEFKNASEGNYLYKYFPPTTPTHKMGNYAIVEVFIFSDPNMATSTLLKKYMEASSSNPSDVKFSQQYADKVLGHYYYASALDRKNLGDYTVFGCLGLRDSGIKPTLTYQKLFGKNYPY